MSGKGSRARRVEATKAARWAVYRANGAEYTDAANPFTCERQRRIFAKSYGQWRDRYWSMESLVAEMEHVYGGRP